MTLRHGNREYVFHVPKLDLDKVEDLDMILILLINKFNTNKTKSKSAVASGS